MKRFLLALPTVVLLAGTAAAEDLPHALTGDLIRIEHESCGTSTGYAPDFVRRVDLDGDGRADVVLDYSQALCGGLPEPYCTAQGCLLVAWRAEKAGWRKLFEGRARSWSVGEAGGRAALIVDGRAVEP